MRLMNYFLDLTTKQGLCVVKTAAIFYIKCKNAYIILKMAHKL